MNFFRDPEKCARYLLDELPPSKKTVARMGVRTNGDLHLGNILPIMWGFQVGAAFVSQERGFEFIIVLVDLEKEGAFSVTPCPQECHESIAAHNIPAIKQFIESARGDGVDLSFIRISEVQKKKPFRDALAKLIEKRPEVLRQVSCYEHGRLINAHDALSTDSCASLLLSHDLLGAVENHLLPLDLHILGSDHEIIPAGDNSSPLEKRCELQALLGSEKKYVTLLTPLVLSKDGEKMSKSAGNGIFLSELRSRFGENTLSELTKFSKKVWGEKSVRVSLGNEGLSTL